jgi:hypothetical protein
MSDRPAQKPDFCPFIYRTRDEIFLEFDALVLRFPFAEGGLSKALQHIPDIASQPGFASRNVADLVMKKMKRRILTGAKARIAKAPSAESQKAAMDDFLKGKKIPTKEKRR